MKSKLLVLIAILSFSAISCSSDDTEVNNHNMIKFESVVHSNSSSVRLDTLKFTIYDIDNNVLHSYKEFDVLTFSLDITDGHHFKIQAWDDEYYDFSLDWTLEREGNQYTLETEDLVALFYGEQEYDYSRFFN